MPHAQGSVWLLVRVKLYYIGELPREPKRDAFRAWRWAAGRQRSARRRKAGYIAVVRAAAAARAAFDSPRE